MTDLSKLPPLHPERIGWAIRFDSAYTGTPLDERLLYGETARAALEVVQKLQSGFGFAPDLYDKIEMAKTTVAQGRTVFGALRALMNRK